MSMFLFWIVFAVLIVFLLALDLFVFNRKSHEINIREALWWSAFWIAVALLFNAGIYWFRGTEQGLLFLTGYLLEKSLSLDNLFVFLVIFSYFGVSSAYQHKVLFWGILGALIMRGIFIFSGVTLINRFDWILYVFGAFLIYTGIKLILEKDKEVHPEKNIFIRLARKLFPVSPKLDGDKFFIRENGQWFITPLFLVLLVVESSDVLFAVDSIPAILSVTRDPFIVYTSNIFAILGLRALYFALAGMLRAFHYLHYGLGIILAFIGVKLFLGHYLEIPIHITLIFIAVVVGLSILISIWKPPTQRD